MKNKIDLILFYIRQNFQQIPAPPKNLSLEIVKGCNFSCQYCFSRLYSDRIDQTRRFQCMSSDKVHSLLKDGWVLGCRTVMFGGWGEPTLHPDFYQFLLWAKDIGYAINFTSNGWILDPEKLSLLDERDIVRISIDTMHLKGSPHPQKYIKKMKNLFTLASRKFRIIAVTHGDFTEDIKTMFRENKIDVIYYPLVKEVISTPFLKKRSLLIPCHHPWFSIAVQLDYKIGSCPCVNWISVGQLNEKTKLHDVWYGDEMNNFRKELRSESLPDICKMCDYVNRDTGEWLQALYRIP